MNIRNRNNNVQLCLDSRLCGRSGHLDWNVRLATRWGMICALAASYIMFSSQLISRHAVNNDCWRWYSVKSECYWYALHCVIEILRISIPDGVIPDGIATELVHGRQSITPYVTTISPNPTDWARQVRANYSNHCCSCSTTEIGLINRCAYLQRCSTCTMYKSKVAASLLHSLGLDIPYRWGAAYIQATELAYTPK
jgi:hypothetical protein